MDKMECVKAGDYGIHSFTRLTKTWQVPNLASGHSGVLQSSRDILVCEKCGEVLDPLKED